VKTAHSNDWLRTCLRVFGLCLLGACIYWPAVHTGFIWDDDTFLTLNPLIKAGDGLQRFWFTTKAADYWPMTSSSLWLEWRLWEMNPLGYHTTNIILHISEALLLWRLLVRLNIPGAFIAALLFLVHPLNAESVAWITQRKNLMAMLFFLITCLSFNNYEENKSAHKNHPFKNIWYYFSLIGFICALLSKGSVVLLPLVLLGIIVCKRRIETNDIVNLSPFFIIAVFFAGLNVWFQNHGTHEVIRNASVLERLLGAGIVPWFYLWKIIAPLNLSFIYPEWSITTSDPIYWIGISLTFAVSVICLFHLKSKFKSLALGWLYFCFMLLPVMGLADIYFMKYSLVADHYAHLAILGIIIPAAIYLERFRNSRLSLKAVYTGLIFGIILCLGRLTYTECFKYKNLETLYTKTLHSNPKAWFAETNLVIVLCDAGRIEDAIVHGRNAVALKPSQPETHYNLGCALSKATRFQEAIIQYNQALTLRSEYRDALFNLGNALRALGKIKQAIEAYNHAILLNPSSPQAYNNLGASLADEGRYIEASDAFLHVLALGPSAVEPMINYGNALAEAGKLNEALKQFKKTIDLFPRSSEAHNNYGMALSDADQSTAAIAEFKEAIRLNPSFLFAHSNLAKVLKEAGDIAGSLDEEAIAHGLKTP